MGKIIKPLRVIGDKAEDTIYALLDSGASSSLIRKDVWERIGEYSFKLPVMRTFTMANGEVGIKTDRICMLGVEMKGKLLDGRFYIVDNLVREIIIGSDFMQTWEIKLDLKNEDYTIGIDPDNIEIA